MTMPWWSATAALNTPWNLLNYNPLGLWVAQASSVRIYSADSIDRWYNSSVSADANKHAVQNTPAQMATFNPANVNFAGRPSVHFTDVQRLITGAWASAITPPFTVIACLHLPGTSAANRCYLGHGSDGLKLVNYVATNNKYQIYNNTPGVTVAGPNAIAAPHVISCKWAEGVNACSIRLSTSMGTTVTGSMGAGLSVPSIMLGNQSGLNSGIIGDIYSIGIFPGALSSDTESRIMQGMSAGTGIGFVT